MSETQVKVWNRNKFDHSEMFTGNIINIKAGGYITMDYDEAHRFIGQMFPIKRDKHGVQLPTSYKWLEIDEADKKRAEAFLRNESEEKAKSTFVCFKCLDEFPTKKALIAHVKKNHQNDIADEKTRDQLEDS